MTSLEKSVQLKKGSPLTSRSTKLVGHHKLACPEFNDLASYHVFYFLFVVFFFFLVGFFFMYVAFERFINVVVLTLS